MTRLVTSLLIVALAVVLALFAWATVGSTPVGVLPPASQDSSTATAPMDPLVSVSSDVLPDVLAENESRIAMLRSSIPGHRNGSATPESTPKAHATKPCTLSGQVTGYGGYRVSGVEVTAWLQSLPVGSQDLDLDRDYRDITTDAHGQFAMEAVPGGTYVVEHRFSHESNTGSKEGSPVRLIAPAVGVNLLLARPTIRLRVFDLNGELMQPDQLRSHWKGPSPPHFSSKSSPGAWLLPPMDQGRTIVFEKPGPYVVIATSGSGSDERRGIEFLDIQREHREVNVQLKAIEKRTLTIQLNDEHGQAVQDWTVRAWGLETGISIKPTEMEGTDGTHHLPEVNLPAGRWRLRFEATNGGYLRAFNHDVHVADGDPLHRLVVIEAPRLGGRIEGTVSAGPAPEHILLRHEAGRQYGYSNPFGGGSTTWRSQLHLSGQYTLTVRHDDDDESGKRAPTRESQVTVIPGHTTQIDLH